MPAPAGRRGVKTRAASPKSDPGSCNQGLDRSVGEATRVGFGVTTRQRGTLWGAPPLRQSSPLAARETKPRSRGRLWNSRRRAPKHPLTETVYAATSTAVAPQSVPRCFDVERTSDLRVAAGVGQVVADVGAVLNDQRVRSATALQVGRLGLSPIERSRICSGLPPPTGVTSSMWGLSATMM